MMMPKPTYYDDAHAVLCFIFLMALRLRVDGDKAEQGSHVHITVKAGAAG